MLDCRRKLSSLVGVRYEVLNMSTYQITGIIASRELGWPPYIGISLVDFHSVVPYGIIRSSGRRSQDPSTLPGGLFFPKISFAIGEISL